MRLRPYSFRDVLRALSKIGFKVIRQRGSHVILKGEHGGKRRTVVIPKHKEIAVGTLHGIAFQAGLSVEEFVKLLKEV